MTEEKGLLKRFSNLEQIVFSILFSWVLGTAVVMVILYPLQAIPWIHDLGYQVIIDLTEYIYPATGISILILIGNSFYDVLDWIKNRVKENQK